MAKSSKTITSDQFSWSQHPIANQLIYTITTGDDSIVAGGQFLSAAKIDTGSGELLWSHPGTAFRTTEIISDSTSIKTGGQYNNYAWEELDSAGNSLNSRIPKYASEVYGHKAVFDKQDFWEIYSTTPNGIGAEHFEFHVQKNNALLTTNTANNFNPLAIAYDEDNSELFLAGWKGFEQHQVQIYKLNLNTSLPTLNPLPAATITSPNLVKGDQFVINEMRWDQKQKKLFFVGDAHSYNGNAKLDYGVLGSYEPAKGLNVKYYPFNGFIGDGSVESLQTLDELSNDYYLIGGNDSTSANTTLGKIILADKSDLSIKETISIDIQNNNFDHIKDVLIDENSNIYIGGSGGIHRLGKSSEIFKILIEDYIVSKPKRFNRKSAGKITNFSPSTDTLEISTDSFGIDSSATFASGKNKKAVKKKLAKLDIDFLYDQKKGVLYFNENGADKGFGNGGIIAILKGAPELTARNFSNYFTKDTSSIIPNGLDNNTRTISRPSEFKIKYADKITNFSPSTDTLEINTESFGVDSSATFTIGKNKNKIKQMLAKQDFDFLYEQKKGGLYFNKNGADKGFGDGGIIAILKGAPDLTIQNIDFL